MKLHNPFANRDIGEATICVFCGSSHGKEPLYTEAARRLGTLIGERNLRLVFGAGAVGLMGEVAKAARDAGAPIIGILPQFLRHLEPPLKSADELIITPDLQQRKQRMLALASAFVLLPGGLGTLDEFFEVITEAQLDVHKKPIVLVNLNGYYDPLLQLIKHIVDRGFARDTAQSLFRVAADSDEAIEIVLSALAPGEKAEPAC